jgi:6-phosphogluconate dehydrogenase
MVKAGKPVDDTIVQVLPHFEKGDIIMYAKKKKKKKKNT